MNDHKDRIHIRDLAIPCIIGTKPAERVRRRKVTISLALTCDLARAGKTDDLRHTVDYAAVCKRVTAMVRRSRFWLLERLAQEIADTCLAFPGVTGVMVLLDKSGAIPGCRSVGVCVERRKRKTGKRKR